ncbi:MAG TPA: hypothetical protein VFC78_11830 [Tepidisphaeraceae bacterium]|nr:hypothetical protein [Tepidisphaeraceae bacterium]
MFRFVLLAVILLALATVPVSAAQDSSALINEALDKVTSLEVDGVLPQVMKKITDQTAVPIEVPAKVYDLLPWGEETNIRAKIKNQTLRQALTAITHKLGLTWELGPQAVRLKPRAALERLGRRATVQELAALDILSTTPLVPPASKPDKNAAFTPIRSDEGSAPLRAIVAAVDARLKQVAPEYSIEFRPGDQVKPDQLVNLPRNAMLADALKEVARQTDATWYPWGQNIVVVPKEEQILRQLDLTITRRFNNADIGQVLMDLSAAAGVEFSLEAGALQRVPPEFRKITLLLDNAKVRTALEDVRGVTGLDYTIKPGGLYLWNQNPPAAAPAQPGGVIVAEVKLADGMQLFLRHDDVPEDVLEYIEHKKLEEYKQLREQMKQEHFVPTPATQPAKTVK